MKDKAILEKCQNNMKKGSSEKFIWYMENVVEFNHK